jgi:hypothetical protein
MEPFASDERRNTMRKSIMAMLTVALVTAACGSAEEPTGNAAEASDAQAAMGAVEVSAALVPDLARARLATAKYATDLDRAEADGYTIITPMIPNMGYHFLNPGIEEFDVERPPILVYGRDGKDWQLVAIEWVFPEEPAEPPLDGAVYGTFGAACHYEDGTFELLPSEAACPKVSSETGASFGFWHPPLVTMHVWLWYPNPDGLFAGSNPLMRPFNQG